MQEGAGTDSNPFLNHRWMAVGLPDHANEERVMLNVSFFEHLNIPIEFAKAMDSILTSGTTAMDSILTSGTTLLITDKPMLRPQISRHAQHHNRVMLGATVFTDKAHKFMRMAANIWVNSKMVCPKVKVNLFHLMVKNMLVTLKMISFNGTRK